MMFKNSDDKVWKRRLIGAGLNVGVWTLVGFFFSSQIYFMYSTSKNPISFWVAMCWQLPAVYAFALVTPLVLWLARRFAINRQNWRRNLIIHIFAGVIISYALAFLHVWLDIFSATLYLGKSYETTFSSLSRQAFFILDKELLVYWLLVGMSHAFQYYNHFRIGEVKAARLETLLAQSQLQALKMQLHPHFLFNTLHSISSLLHKDTEAADKMISHLGDFLRLTLEQSGTQVVTLNQELEFLRSYLAIESIRFQDRLTTHIKIDPKALDAQVPYLILQPLIENAIKHGIATRATPGRIEITAERRNAMLRIQVKNDGPKLKIGNNSNGHSKQGLGLVNTQARLDQLYSASCRFELADDPRGGVVATLEIPTSVEMPLRHTP